ncbi:MAG: DUF6503 family protein [Flavobacteriaceae bacterium]
MKSSFRYFSFLMVLFLLACQSPHSINPTLLINKSVKAHGFDQSEFTIDFDFREYHYKLIRKPGFYSYTRQKSNQDQIIRDVMTSKKKLQRFVNDSLFQLPDSLSQNYSSSLNSVHYFFQLPKPLEDPAVIAEVLGMVSIRGNRYWSLKISFNEENGGEDFEDEFRYWIHTATYRIDYLAYNYQTDGGGTRFREATNPREIEGFYFQDYKNFKPQNKDESLDNLPLLFEKGELEKVSLIENNNIRVSKQLN